MAAYDADNLDIQNEEGQPDLRDQPPRARRDDEPADANGEYIRLINAQLDDGVITADERKQLIRSWLFKAGPNQDSADSVSKALVQQLKTTQQYELVPHDKVFDTVRIENDNLERIPLQQQKETFLARCKSTDGIDPYEALFMIYVLYAEDYTFFRGLMSSAYTWEQRVRHHNVFMLGHYAESEDWVRTQKKAILEMKWP